MAAANKKKRTKIYDGVRFLRWVMLTVIIWQVIGIFDDNPFTQTDWLVLLVAILLFLIFWVLRRVEFDEEAIYRVYGNRENAVPFGAVVRIEKSGVAMNDRKMWRLRYIDKDNKERKFLFLEGNFQSGSVNELIKRVEAINENLEVERSYIWNQWEHQKRRKAARKDKRNES